MSTNNHRQYGNQAAHELHDGILLVDKPAGPTSHDIVDKVRKTFKLDKVGHGGTLDPQATGLLVLLIGRGTKLSNSLMGSDKCYEGTLRLGSSTDSQDAAGKELSSAPFEHITQEMLETTMATFNGDQMQIPPMVSAIKKDGVPLYKLARKGKTVEREPKFIHLYKFSLNTFGLPDSTFEVLCTKGTYVRTLCHDIGEKLGCGGHLAQLRRTRSGHLSIDDAVGFEELIGYTPAQMLERIIPAHKVVRDLS